MPYLINSGTAISTDPAITTQGVTDYGTIYRDLATDGSRATWLFGATSAFDTHSGFEGGPDTSTYLNNIAVFKFQSLEIDGMPTISTVGGVTNLGLVGVDSLATGAPGGALSFSGIGSLLLATQAGPITLTSDVSFQNIDRLFIYARGNGSYLSIGSSITTNDDVRLYSEGFVTINGNINTVNFSSFSGGAFTAGSGVVTAGGTYIGSDTNIAFNTDQFSAAGFNNTSLSLNATGTLDITLQSNLSVFTAASSILAEGANLNIFAGQLTTLDLSNATSASFIASNGDLIGDNVDFLGGFVSLFAPAGNIRIGSLDTTYVNDQPVLGGSVGASGSIAASGNLESGLIQSIGSEIDAGGQIIGSSIDAFTDINGAQGITAYGGSIIAGGNITSSNGSIQLQQRPNGTFGNITAGGNISAAGGIFTPGDPVVVMAGGSITAPGVITGTLRAGTDITIDNSAGSFGFGIVANNISAGGTLHMINSPTISPNNGGFGGNDGETFNDFFMTVGSIASTGPTYPILSSNGGDANPNFSDSNPGNGGNITLTTTAGGLTIGNGQNLDSIAANGGAYNAAGPFGGGNGGKIDIISAGDVVINNGANNPGISATSGTVSDDTTQFAGNGGTVNVTSDASITVNGTVQASSEDARFQQTIGRESASGGTIDLQSNLTTGQGITIATGGQLNSFLNGNAPGPAGSITLSTMGADIVVNGTVRADFGTITLNQDNPFDATPTITLDGATLQAATFDINGGSDLTIGPNNNTAINIFGGTWNVMHNITINAATTSFAYSFALNATAGNAINFTGGSTDIAATLALPLSSDSTFTAAAGSINAQYVDILYSGGGLNLIAGGNITAHSIAFTDFYARGSVNAGGALSVTADLFEGNATAGTSVNIGGNTILSTLTAGTTVTAGGYIQASSVTAGGDISADITYVQTINSPSGVLTVANGIKPYVFSTDPMFPEQGAKAPHVYTVDSIVSPNGIDFSGNQFDGINGYSSGGILTINANTLSFDPSSGIGPVNFNGADVNGFSTGNTPTAPGDGGTFTVNATGDITVSSTIEATTGLVAQNASPAGNGGTVNLNSSDGTISVNSRIEVSSNDSAAPTPSPTPAPPRRRSAQGGNISLTSGKSAGVGARTVAINISSSGQLLSLLAAAPTPRPGGKVTILATGANSDVNLTGAKVQADGGTIDIRNNGDAGHVNIAGVVGAAAVPSTLSADVIKAGAFGPNGQLNIGTTNMSADTLIRLYATSSNGSLNFLANTTLSSPNIALAAGTVSIANNVIVTIASSNPANVYTTNPNYSTTNGGNNGAASAGRFSGPGGLNGVNAPQPLASAPPFDSAPPRPANRIKPGG